MQLFFVDSMLLYFYIKKCGTNPLKKRMKHYDQELESFMELTTVFVTWSVTLGAKLWIWSLNYIKLASYSLKKTTTSNSSDRFSGKLIELLQNNH